jgi:glutamyl-tRNA synthetase
MSVRVRFAPSPTGSLHVGGARTALFNWLFARHHGGTFVLRIEDTDASRSTLESERTLLEDLRWLGLDWDEGPEVEGAPHGPYRQSERKEIYRAAADRLRAAGRLYPCFCDEEELDRKRKEAEEKGLSARYDGTCRMLPAGEADRRIAAGERPVWRFPVDDSETTGIDDLVRGHIEWSGEALGDFVVLRSDGMPVYNFAVVVDDAAMKITHVLRAEEHLTNTHRQVLLYRALGEEPPQFGHVSLILAPDRSKLSKRHGATSVGEFRAQGFFPEALVNFLALLGWNPGDEREVMGIDELVREFSLDRVNRAPAIFNLEKLAWMNGEYVRSLPAERLAAEASSRLAAAGLDAPLDPVRLAGAVELQRPRAKGLVDLADSLRVYFVPPAAYEEADVAKHVKGPAVPEQLDAFAGLLEGAADFSHAPLEEAGRRLAESLGVGPGKLFQPVRIGLVGRAVSPGLFELISVLGREESIRRIRAFAAFLRARVA